MSSRPESMPPSRTNPEIYHNSLKQCELFNIHLKYSLAFSQIAATLFAFAITEDQYQPTLPCTLIMISARFVVQSLMFQLHFKSMIKELLFKVKERQVHIRNLAG